jgi:D-amino-acid dehydrogenase
MDIVVIGAGIVGLASAWQLRRDGHRVTVVDRSETVAAGASHANGGQLSYRYVAPLADPDVLAKLPGWMLRRDAPVRFRPRFDPDQWRWIARFLRACNAGDKQRTVASLLPLSLYSRALMHELATGHGLAFDHVRSGKLVLYRDAASYASARRLLAVNADLAAEQHALDGDACLAVEPALERLRGHIRGAIHTPGEEAGDCLTLCRALAARLSEGPNAVRFALGREVTALAATRGRVTAAVAADERFAADAFVLANGVAAPALMRPLGVTLPIYPVKGYSISVAVTDAAALPATSVTDFERKIVYARLGGRLRVAGMADIVGLDDGIERRRVATLVRETRETFGTGVDHTTVMPWAGMRPATPGGRPIIDRAGASNLWLNVGHGALGFTLAMGSARVLADRLAGHEPVVPDAAFALAAAHPRGGSLWRSA